MDSAVRPLALLTPLGEPSAGRDGAGGFELQSVGSWGAAALQICFT